MFGDGHEAFGCGQLPLDEVQWNPMFLQGFLLGLRGPPIGGNMTIRTRSISFAGKGAVLALATTMLVAVSGANPAQAASSGLSQSPPPAVNTLAGESLTELSARAKKRNVKRHIFCFV